MWTVWARHRPPSLSLFQGIALPVLSLFQGIAFPVLSMFQGIALPVLSILQGIALPVLSMFQGIALPVLLMLQYHKGSPSLPYDFKGISLPSLFFFISQGIAPLPHVKRFWRGKFPPAHRRCLRHGARLLAGARRRVQVCQGLYRHRDARLLHVSLGHLHLSRHPFPFPFACTPSALVSDGPPARLLSCGNTRDSNSRKIPPLGGLGVLL